MQFVKPLWRNLSQQRKRREEMTATLADASAEVAAALTHKASAGTDWVKGALSSATYNISQPPPLHVGGNVRLEGRGIQTD